MLENKPFNCKNIKVHGKINQYSSEENKNNLSNIITENICNLKKGNPRLIINSLFILKKEDLLNIYWILEDNNITKRKNDLLTSLTFETVIETINIEHYNRDNFLYNLKKDLSNNWQIYDIPK